MQPILERVNKNGQVSAEEVKDIVDYSLIMREQRDHNMAAAESEITSLKDTIIEERIAKEEAEKALENEKKQALKMVKEYIDTEKIKGLDAIRAEKLKQAQAPVKEDTHPLPPVAQDDTQTKRIKR